MDTNSSVLELLTLFPVKTLEKMVAGSTKGHKVNHIMSALGNPPQRAVLGKMLLLATSNDFTPYCGLNRGKLKTDLIQNAVEKCLGPLPNGRSNMDTSNSVSELLTSFPVKTLKKMVAETTNEDKVNHIMSMIGNPPEQAVLIKMLQLVRCEEFTPYLGQHVGISKSDLIQNAVTKCLGPPIHVRDFAYESILPPIPAFVSVYRQVQPGADVAPQRRDGHGPRGLKRKRRDGVKEADGPVGDDNRQPVQKRNVMRVGMDLAQDASNGHYTGLRREGALLSLDETAEADLRRDMFRDSESQGYVQSQRYSQHARSAGSSQDTELIVTPLVTPNGSLQWLDGEGPHSLSPPLVPTEPSSPLATSEPDTDHAMVRQPTPPHLAGTDTSIDLVCASSPLLEAPSSAPCTAR
ncbi:hypothetical protein MVEN_00069300 [Mycena venus]|uniref:Uncharacterized protein n=1 Tax=Mycena venus TaxID=2733690 RepID=A0A8H6Z861_9AGAR|nr:hypothetical protein MVEN_00069300 [Mycena venus]